MASRTNDLQILSNDLIISFRLLNSVQRRTKGKKKISNFRNSICYVHVLYFESILSITKQNETKQKQRDFVHVPWNSNRNLTEWHKHGDNENCKWEQHQCYWKLLKNLHSFQYFMRRNCNFEFLWNITTSERLAKIHI